MAIPKPDPKDWLKASATELRLGDRETLKLLQESYKAVQTALEGLPDGEGAAFGKLVQRAQMERVRRELLAEQARLFDRLGDKVSARRLRSATRAAKLSRVADRALLNLAGAGDEGKRLYDGATITAQRTLDTMLARIGLSKLPLAERIYNTRVWMDGRLDRLINGELSKGLNAARFAKVARDWFNPSVKGGTRYAAMRLARTEINNAFHATSITYAQDKPWVSKMDWNLSDSHPVPDKCNEYADLSPWDVYAVPRKPHPQCLCNVTERAMGEDEWMDKFIAGDFDEYLDRELDKADEQLGIKREPQKAKKVGTSAPGPVVALQKALVPSTLVDAPPLQEFQKNRYGGRFFGYNSESMSTAKERSPAENLALLDQQSLVELQTTTYLPSRLEALRALDEEFTRRTGQTNDRFFERQMVEFLSTPEGVEKARSADAVLSQEVSKLADADALAHAAKSLRDRQPDLPPDSANFSQWDAAKARAVWERLTTEQPLSEDAVKGLRYYSTSPGYIAMNRRLRGLDITAKDKVKADVGIPQTREGLRPLPEPVLLNRLTGAAQFKALGGRYQRLADLVGTTGKTFRDNGFTSSAVSGGKLTAGDVKLEIEVPAGVPVAYMEKITKHKGEQEMLLSDGLEFTVLRAEYDPVEKRVTMRVRVTNWPGKEGLMWRS
jgi:hypothetical protein